MSDTLRVSSAPSSAPSGVHARPVDDPLDGFRSGGVLETDRVAASMMAGSGGDPAVVQSMKALIGEHLSPVERGKVDRALAEAAEGMSLGDHVVDGVAQFGKGVWSTVKGLGSLAWSGAKTAYDLNPVGLAVSGAEWATGSDLPDYLPTASRGAERVQAGGEAIAALGKAVWDDPSILIAEYETLADEGRYGAIVGQAVADFGDLLIGTKGAGKAGRVAGLAANAGDIAKVSRAADTALDLARTVGRAEDGADALRMTRGALREIEVRGGLPDDVAAKVTRARTALDEALAPTGARRAQTGGSDFASPADEAYDAIRVSRTDVSDIAQNTGLKDANVQRVKDHVFNDEHLLDRYVDLGVPAEVRRFDSNLDQADAWQRLENGTHTPEDIAWMKHEMAEAWFMENVAPGYNAAHNAAQQRYPSPY